MPSLSVKKNSIVAALSLGLAMARPVRTAPSVSAKIRPPERRTMPERRLQRRESRSAASRIWPVRPEWPSPHRPPLVHGRHGAKATSLGRRGKPHPYEPVVKFFVVEMRGDRNRPGGVAGGVCRLRHEQAANLRRISHGGLLRRLETAKRHSSPSGTRLINSDSAPPARTARRPPGSRAHRPRSWCG